MTAPPAPLVRSPERDASPHPSATRRRSTLSPIPTRIATRRAPTRSSVGSVAASWSRFTAPCARSSCTRSRTRRSSRRSTTSRRRRARSSRKRSELEFRTSGEFIFINSTRLRLDLDNYASFSHLLSLFRSGGIGSLRVAESVTPRDWLVFLSLVQAPGEGEPEDRFEQLNGKLALANVTTLELGPPAGGAEIGDRQQSKEAAKRTYAQSVAVSKEVMHSVRMGRAPNVKKLKRVVQAIVDQILNDETSLFGLTTLRDYDEYTFTHSVNVCIFAVALGRRLGLSKLQLYDLGLAALFHDIGKARVPVDVLNKSTALSEEDWRAIANHPWLGVLSLFQVRSAQDLPYRVDGRRVRAPHENGPDRVSQAGTGPPAWASSARSSRSPTASMPRRRADRIRTDPLTPAAVLQEMRDNPTTRHGSRRRQGVHQLARASILWARSSSWIRSSSVSCTPSTRTRK